MAVPLGRVTNEMVATRAPRPKLLVLADGVALETLRDLFGHRGFVIVPLSSRLELERHVLRADAAPAAAVLDFRHPEAETACAALRARHPQTIVVAIADEHQVPAIQDAVDGAFCPPVDRALLFVRVVQLIAARRHGGAPFSKITGVVGVIRGNDLFQRALAVLHAVVPPVNAGAILERALAEIDARPDSVTEPDLAAIVASGRLADVLGPFADAEADDDDSAAHTEVLHTTLAMLLALLNSPASLEDPCIPVRMEGEITARTCG
jgi:hypothetical protein